MKKISRFLELLFMGGVRSRVRVFLPAMVFFRNNKNTTLAKLIEVHLQKKYGLFISHKATFPKSIDLKHPIGVVIGEGVILGERVKIFQHVTLGGARIGDWQENNYPQVGDDTVIFAGAVIIGKISIGKNCIIGANSVVTQDIPDYTTAAGVPARIIRQQAPNNLET